MRDKIMAAISTCVVQKYTADSTCFWDNVKISDLKQLARDICENGEIEWGMKDWLRRQGANAGSYYVMYGQELKDAIEKVGMKVEITIYSCGTVYCGTSMRFTVEPCTWKLLLLLCRSSVYTFGC